MFAAEYSEKRLAGTLVSPARDCQRASLDLDQSLARVDLERSNWVTVGLAVVRSQFHSGEEARCPSVPDYQTGLVRRLETEASVREIGQC